MAAHSVHRTDTQIRRSAAKAIDKAMTPEPPVGPKDPYRDGETRNDGIENRPSRCVTTTRDLTSHFETNPSRRKIAPATAVQTAVKAPVAGLLTPTVQESALPDSLLRPLKRKLKDIESEWEDKEYVSKLKGKLKDVKERNAELVAYVVELEDMVEALQAKLAK